MKALTKRFWVSSSQLKFISLSNQQLSLGTFYFLHPNTPESLEYKYTDQYSFLFKITNI